MCVGLIINLLSMQKQFKAYAASGACAQGLSTQLVNFQMCCSFTSHIAIYLLSKRTWLIL